MRLGVGAWKDGGTVSIAVKCQGIPDNPASCNHHLPMKIQFNTPKRGGEEKGQTAGKLTKART